MELGVISFEIIASLLVKVAYEIHWASVYPHAGRINPRI